jgi:hypothetical protein
MSIKRTVRLDEFRDMKAMMEKRQAELRALLDNKENALANAVAPDLERFHDNTRDALALLNQLEVTDNNGVRIRISEEQQAKLASMSDVLMQDASTIANHARAIFPEVVHRPAGVADMRDHDITNAVVNPIVAISGALELIASGLEQDKGRTSVSM